MLKRSLQKVLLFFMTLVFLLSFNSYVFAAETNADSVYANTSLEVVENNVCTITVDEYGEFTKQITEYNATEKSVTLTLTMTNLKTVEESQRDVEIFFVIDNSSSMNNEYQDTTRKQAVIESANSLIAKLFASNSKVKIGLVSFSTSDSNEGSIDDANLELPLSNDLTEVQSAISNLSDSKVGYRTNIDAGLSVAQNNFSSDEDVDRYIILLTDGVPNTTTTGITLTYSGETATVTKARIAEIENSGISIIGAMINLDENVSVTIDNGVVTTYRELAEEIFGTEENSTLTKCFYIPDSEIEDTIVNDIFDSITTTVDNTLKNITITDYFPQEIIDNFDFEYVSSPNIGTVSQTINTENNSITWFIELLSEGETATLSYKLTLKEDYDENIIDVILQTNEGVDITGETPDGEITETSDVSPTVVVRYDEPEEEVVDNTISTDTKLPQTGDVSNIILAVIVILTIVTITRMIIVRKKFNK